MTNDHNNSDSRMPDTVLCLLMYVYIGRGRQNATTRNELCKLCGIEPTRTNRRRITRLRRRVQERYSRKLAFCNDGYYFVETPRGEQEGKEYMLSHKTSWDENIESYDRAPNGGSASQSHLDEFQSEW